MNISLMKIIRGYNQKNMVNHGEKNKLNMFC